MNPDDEEHLEAMKRHAVQRWILMAFLPGLLALPFFWVGFWLGDASGTLGLLIWGGFSLTAVFGTGFCTVKLAGTAPHPSKGRHIAAGIGWFIALAIGNYILAAALIFGSCAITKNSGF